MTKEQWEAWKRNPVTVAYFDSLEEERASGYASTNAGRHLGEIGRVEVNYARAVGRGEGLTFALENVPEWAREE